MDWQSIQPLFTWLSEHPSWAGLIVFLIAFSESLFVVGLIVPGTVLMFGVGTLIGTGVLEIKQTLFIAFLGAVMGDGLSYWLGAVYQKQLSTIWPLKNNPHYLQHGKDFFIKHGGKSVLFGRFIGPVRPLIPTVAGMMGMSKKYFFSINVISAAAWAPFYLLPGIVFGTSIGLASIVGTRLVLLLVLLFFSAFLLVWLTRKMMTYVAPRVERFYFRTYQLAIKNPKLGGLVKAIIDPDTAERRGLYFFSILIMLSLILIALFVAQFSSSSLFHVNDTVANFALLIRTPFGDQLMLVVSEFFSWPVLSLTMLSCVAVLMMTKNQLALNHLMLLLLLSSFSAAIANSISDFAVFGGEKFADLKVLLFSSFGVFFAVIASHKQSFSRRWIIFSLLSLTLLLTSLVVLYFGKSTMTELLGSLSVSFLWVLLIATAYRRHSTSVQKLMPLTVGVAAVFLISGIVWASQNYTHDYADVMVESKKTIVSYQDWQSAVSSQLPFQRHDMFGVKKQILNLQWLGDADSIRQVLLKDNWQVASMADYKTILYWIKPEVRLDELPRIPQTHNGKHEVLSMVRYLENQQRVDVLQLWPTVYTVKENNRPLWIGSITRQFISPEAKWLPYLTVKPLLRSDMLAFEEKLVTQGFLVQQSRVTDVLLISSGNNREK